MITRQKVPFMATANISKTAVVFGRIIEPDPTREVSYRFCSRPVRIILMPFDHRTVTRGFDEKLIMPKPHRAVEQLLGDFNDPPQEDKVVKAGRKAPCP